MHPGEDEENLYDVAVEPSGQSQPQAFYDEARNEPIQDLYEDPVSTQLASRQYKYTKT